MFEEFSGASFSECRKYRYLLWRVWDESKPAAVFLMLNPSTADDVDNDPTVERCQRRVHALGYGSLKVVNIFAYRSTIPQPCTSSQIQSGQETMRQSCWPRNLQGL